MRLKRVDKWNVTPKGVSQEDWQKKSKKDKIHVWVLIYAAGMGSPVVDFLLGLDDGRAILGIEERNLMEFINYNNDHFEMYPIVYNHLESILKHPRFIKENAIGAFQELKVFIEKITPIKKELPTQQSKKEDLNNNDEPKNLTVSTIEDWLFEFKERKVLREPHYSTLANALYHYFKNGEFPQLENGIKVGRVNKKLFGWHLNRIFYSEGKGIEVDLLRFAKVNISTFKDVDFDESDLQKSNLYKYFTTKTK